MTVADGSDAGSPFNYHEKYAGEVLLMHAATAVAAEPIGVHRSLLQSGGGHEERGLSLARRAHLRWCRQNELPSVSSAHAMWHTGNSV